MRRFLALVFMLGLAIPAGVSISGCYRNPAGKYCPETSGYGLLQTQVASITLQPAIAGISLAYGQTTQVQLPKATTCIGTAVSVAGADYAYGTTNNQLVDISPTGVICAGSWNRNTGGGIANYTYCNPPNPLPQTSHLPYAVAYITATADSVTSNPVAVYVHPQVTSVSLYVPPPPSSTTGLSCYSQGTVAQLDAQACYSEGGTQYELCAPTAVTTSATPNLACSLPTVNGTPVPLSSIPTCESSIGTLTFNVGNSSIASLNSTDNQITAEQPGTTPITASIAGSGSSAGYFSTCPPASISVTLANGATSGTVTQGVPQNLTTTVVDTNGNVITGLGLTYQSTNPIDIQAGSTGQISTLFPGVGSITAICQGTCNSAPTNLTGYNGTGVSLSSNPVNLTTPGTASDYVWFGAPGASQYFASIELLTGAVSSTVALPYVPNSMVMDRGGNSLYFGSARELMVYSTTTNGITAQTAVPGVVLAVSPNNSQVLINDQARHLFYLYNVSGGTILSFPGMGNAAQWTPDSQTLYITDNADLNTPTTGPNACSTPLITGHTNALYVYSASTGWSTFSLPLPASPLPANAQPGCDAQPNTAAALPGPSQTPAVMIPSVGAYLRGNPTTVHTWCPSGTVGNQATIQYYPEGDPASGAPAVESDALAATVEGNHILGASLSGSTIDLADIAITVPGTTTTTSNGTNITVPISCPLSVSGTTQTMSPLIITPTAVNTVPITGVNANWVDQVVTGATPASTSGGAGSSLAFITYNGNGTGGALLPYYQPTSGGVPGTPGTVTLTDCPPTLAPNNTPNPAYPCNSTITAPIAGAFSPDNTIFFVSTSGDNEIHYITIPSSITSTSVPTDSSQISPKLPGCDPSTDAGCNYTGSPGSIVPATVIEVKPRSTT